MGGITTRSQVWLTLCALLPIIHYEAWPVLFGALNVGAFLGVRAGELVLADFAVHRRLITRRGVTTARSVFILSH